MSLFIASLNSGSNGNCYYVGNDREAILVDAGLSCRETERRMRHCGLSPDKVKAIFISHEHGDHIRGLDVLSRKYRLPVYISGNTLSHSRLRLDAQLVQPLSGFSPVNIGGLSITAFPKHHDAADPHSFIVKGNNVCIGIFTDIGVVCEQLVRHFKMCHAAFLEANYDEDMLERGMYPFHLKRRISGGKGHLSNTQALDLFTMHRPHFMSHVLLSHLSKDNNSPELVADLFNRHAGDTEVVIAGRFTATSVYEVKNLVGPAGLTAPATVKVKAQQLSLF
jgi:phosphoribosyl 1,2-cyclic phosphodiesterase